MEDNTFETTMSTNNEYIEYVEPITQEQLDEANNKASEFENKWKYALADCDNIRKRMNNEISNIRQYKYENLLKDLLPTIDNFERAFHAYNDNQDKLTKKGREILDGMNLIYKSFCETLRNNGLMKMKVNTGDMFNSGIMEAISMTTEADVESNQVVTVVNTGYTYNDKIIRYPQVIVKQ